MGSPGNNKEAMEVGVLSEVISAVKGVCRCVWKRGHRWGWEPVYEPRWEVAQDSDLGHGKRWSPSGSILKAELLGLNDELDVG